MVFCVIAQERKKNQLFLSTRTFNLTFRAVARNCHNLETFAVLASDYVTNDAIEHLALSTRTLRRLLLRDLTSVTDGCLERLVSARPELEVYHEKWAREERRAFRYPGEAPVGVVGGTDAELRETFDATVNRNPSLETLLAL